MANQTEVGEDAVSELTLRNGCVVAVDIGGTFTDIVLLGPEGLRKTLKVSSTPPYFERAVVSGLLQLLADLPVSRGRIDRLAHGTTVATNALLERRGVRTALVTTAGFRDVLELARMRRPSLFDLDFVKPEPLAPRDLRFEIDERTDSSGEVIVAPDPTSVELLVAELVHSEALSVAVCFINSYRNSHNEDVVARLIREALPEVSVTCSFELLPEIKEYERTSTTVVNAYVRPTVDEYLGRLDRGLAGLGAEEVEVHVMQSNGSLLESESSRRHPVRMIESGPAAGVVAAEMLLRKIDVPDAIAFDMGGTTAKASLIENFRHFEAAEYEVGGSMNQSQLFKQGAGYTVRVPSIDIAEVGAGGGSIFWIDDGGAPRVGPASAGAVPGPVCYAGGGDAVTVTDANLVLGYLNPESIAGGTQPVNYNAAVDAVAKQVARPLSMSLLEAAYGVHTLANSGMGQAIRRVTIERGRDPRNFTLVAFGGAGPMHSALIASMFEVDEIVVPVNPGLFSALGLQVAGIRQDYVVSYPDPDNPSADVVASLFAELAKRVSSVRASSRARADNPNVEKVIDLRYRGQAHELSVIVPANELGSDWVLSTVIDDFHAAHATTYGYSNLDEVPQVVNLRIRATWPTRTYPNVFAATDDQTSTQLGTTREAYFGTEYGLVDTPVLSRPMLHASEREGPCIVEDMDATTVVPPNFFVRRDEDGNLFIRRSV